MSPMSDTTDFYELLGVSRTASDDELKKAYRAKARELHPDANPDDPSAEERFKRVSIAYEVLKDPEKRRRYDQFGAAAFENGGGGGAGDFGFGGGLGDIFEAFFGGAGSPFGGNGRTRGPSGPPRGQDMEVVADLDFEHAVFGTETEVTLRQPVACDSCSASGAAPGTQAVTCTTCQGSGEVRQIRNSLLGQMVTAAPCGRCRGMGMTIETPCPTCRGEGRRTEERTYTFTVPAGVDSGSGIRLTGRGAAGPRGGPNGNLIVHIRVKPHPRFERHGIDLVHVLDVAMTQAILGVHIPFETLDGVEDLLIPAGSQNGRVFRLRGRGVPQLNGRGRGDLIVQINVVVPSGLSKTEEELVRRLADERGEAVAPPDKSLLGKIKSAFR
jgi:molecular chaperone DnaJ